MPSWRSICSLICAAVGGAVLLELGAVAALKLRHRDRLALTSASAMSGEAPAVVALFDGTKKKANVRMTSARLHLSQPR